MFHPFLLDRQLDRWKWNDGEPNHHRSVNLHFVTGCTHSPIFMSPSFYILLTPQNPVPITMPSLPTENRQVVLAERPGRGPVTSKTFNLSKAGVPDLKDDQILVRVLYSSVVSPSLLILPLTLFPILGPQDMVR